MKSVWNLAASDTTSIVSRDLNDATVLLANILHRHFSFLNHSPSFLFVQGCECAIWKWNRGQTGLTADFRQEVGDLRALRFFVGRHGAGLVLSFPGPPAKQSAVVRRGRMHCSRRAAAEIIDGFDVFFSAILVALLVTLCFQRWLLDAPHEGTDGGFKCGRLNGHRHSSATTNARRRHRGTAQDPNRRPSGRMRHMQLTIRLLRETDGRWIGDIPELPGVTVYGATPEEATRKAKVLALRVIAEEIEHGEMPSGADTLRFSMAA
jgi:predicted RNase H-like HicB family nuclease